MPDDRVAPLAAASRGAEEADRERIIRVEGRSRPQARFRRLASALRLRHAPGASGRRRARDCRGGAAAQSRRAGDGPISRHRARGRARKGAPLDGTLLRRPDAVDLAAFESEEGRRLEAAIAQLSPEARRELIALIYLNYG